MAKNKSNDKTLNKDNIDKENNSNNNIFNIAILILFIFGIICGSIETLMGFLQGINVIKYLGLFIAVIGIIGLIYYVIMIKDNN